MYLVAKQSFPFWNLTTMIESAGNGLVAKLGYAAVFKTAGKESP
jgi:hypothetical protein